MAISGNYAPPVWVNGYQCKNCTDVDNAKKNIDPAHPQSGPFGIDAKIDPTRSQIPAVTYGGALSGLSASSNSQAPPTASSSSAQQGSGSSSAPSALPYGVGAKVDLSV